MIEINLVPVELQNKNNKKRQFIISKQLLILSLPVVIGLLVLFQLLTQLLIIVDVFTLKHLDKVWADIQPQKKQIDEIRAKMQDLKAYDYIIQRLSTQRLIAAPKLNLISDALAPGVWLEEISLSAASLELKGSCVSASGQELIQIGKFLNTIKNDKIIASEFPRLELTSIQRNRLANIDIVEFVISSKGSKNPTKQ